MAYTPINTSVYVAAYVGALEGITSVRGVGSYPGIAAVCGAYAQQFDTTWGPRATSSLDLNTIENESAGIFEERGPIQTAGAKVPTQYVGLVASIITIVNDVRAYFAAQGITPPPLEAPITAFAILRPGAPSAAPAYATIEEIIPLVVAADGAFTLYVDSSIAPAHLSTNLDGQDRLTIAPARGPVGGVAMTLIIDDGRQLSGLYSLQGQIRIDALATTIAPFVPADVATLMYGGAEFRLLAGSTRPFMDVNAGQVAAFIIQFSSKYSTLAAGIPFADLLDATSVFSNFYVELSPFTQPQDNTVRTFVASTLIYVYDASVTLPSQAGAPFFGTLLTFPMVKGQVNRGGIEFPLNRFNSQGPVSGGSFIMNPWVSGTIANAMICSPVEIYLVESFAGPGLTAVDLQIVSGSGALGVVPLTGDADGMGPTGIVAPYPPVQHSALLPLELPQFQFALTGATADLLTAGHVKISLAYAVAP